MTPSERELTELNEWLIKHLDLPETDGNPINHPLGGRKINYPADPAAALLVLEKCLEKLATKQIVEELSLWKKEETFSVADLTRLAKASTLPLAICLLAKKLFGGEA